jgi:pSer/pThr/pTyr-binding forkhead associated (FHA) protein
VSLVFASGPLAGSEISLEKPRVTIGRAKTAEVVVDDASISHQHAALELGSNGYRIRDLGSTNGVQVNGARMALAELKHGDRFALGQIELRYVVEDRAPAPKTHSVDES